MTKEEIKSLLSFCKENENKDTLEQKYDEIKASLEYLESNFQIKPTEYWYLRIYFIESKKSISAHHVHLQECIDLSKELETIDCIEVLAKVYIIIGNIYNATSDFFDSIHYFKKGKEIFEQLQIKNEIAICLNNLGSAYRNTGNIPAALEALNTSLKINEELNNSKGIAYSLSNIGLLYYYLSDFTTALDFFEQARELNTQLNNTKSLAVNLANIANIYVAFGDFTIALEFFEEAYALIKNEKNVSSLSSIIGNIGDVYLRLKDYPQALSYLLNALEIDQKKGNKRSISIRYVNLAHLYKSTDYEHFDIDKAIDYCKQSTELAKEIGYTFVEIQSYKCFAEIYEHLKDFTKAYHFHKKYYEMEKSLQNEDSKKQAQMLQLNRKLEATERERQIKIAKYQEQERLLHDILPSNIANRILQGETTIAEYSEKVCVFFSDIVSFTEISQTIQPNELVNSLNSIFQVMDSIAKKYSIEKIKTIGDAYMAVSGIDNSDHNAHYNIAMFAFEVIEKLRFINLGNQPFEVRIGLHIGDVVSGVIGGYKFSYDIWGDTVNIASRMESNSKPSKVHITEAFAFAIKDRHEFSVIPRGEITIKGKGTMNTYWLEKA